jgi:hypothetical protein
VTFDEQVDQLMALFPGSVRSFGQFDPKRVDDPAGPHFTVKKTPTREDYARHVRGERGIGVVPIQRDRFCTWGAIDIDVYDIDHIELEAAVRDNEFPLIVCRSKSGGAHLYMFLSESVLATAVRAALREYAKKLGYPAAEIFPKQNETSETALGNWINLPYFGGNESVRPAVEGGKNIEFGLFLENARNKAVSRTTLFHPDKEHAQAPPCIQAMIKNGVGPGMRNEALYSIGVYLKKAHPEGSWKDKLMDVNASFDDPIPASEVRTLQGSIARRDYQYKCKADPLKSLCDSNVCVTRKFGITPAEQKTMVDVEQQVFANLKKHTTEPVYWEIDVNGSAVRVLTPDLMDYRRFQEKVAEWQTRLLPTMKNGDWHVILGKLMSEAQVIEAPDEASAPGQVRAQLRTYIERAAQLDSRSVKENLTRGMPYIAEDGGKVIAYFVGPAFEDYLKKQRADVVKGAQLWMALRRMDVQSGRMRVGQKVLSVWSVEMDGATPLLRQDMTLPEFKTEF